MTEPAKKEGPCLIYENSRTRIVINRKWCKGCDICTEFCPQQTLVLQDGKAAVADLSTCTGCMLCEMRCPDFAIEIERKE